MIATIFGHNPTEVLTQQKSKTVTETPKRRKNLSGYNSLILTV